jgi:hypothetical protein
LGSAFSLVAAAVDLRARRRLGHRVEMGAFVHLRAPDR